MLYDSRAVSTLCCAVLRHSKVSEHSSRVVTVTGCPAVAGGGGGWRGVVMAGVLLLCGIGSHTVIRCQWPCQTIASFHRVSLSDAGSLCNIVIICHMCRCHGDAQEVNSECAGKSCEQTELGQYVMVCVCQSVCWAVYRPF